MSELGPEYFDDYDEPDDMPHDLEGSDQPWVFGKTTEEKARDFLTNFNLKREEEE